MKYKSKSEFLERTDKEWTELWNLIKQSESNPGFEGAIRKILVHLYAWHRLVQDWIRIGENGVPDLPAKGFNWRQIPELNKHLDAKYSDVSYSNCKRRLKRSHRTVMNYVEGWTEDQLLKPDHFTWTGRNAVVAYIGPNTCSHYRWAIKKLKVLLK